MEEQEKHEIVNSTNDTEIRSKEELSNLLKNEFATGFTKVYVNSLQREIGFREITVKEQKTLTKTISVNENRKDIVYDAQCALIQTLCQDKNNFDVYKISEFDRLKLLLALYQANMFSNDIKFTCPQCGKENKYKIDFQRTIEKLNSFDLSERQFEYENKNFKYIATIEYPIVKLISDFHKAFAKEHKVRSSYDAKTNDTMENMEYIQMFIKSIQMQNKTTGKKVTVAFRVFPISQIEESMNMFPQDLMYSENGLIKHIVDSYIKAFNEAFDKHQCYNCGETYEKGDSNNIQNFF